MASLHLCDVIILNPPKPAVFHPATSFNFLSVTSSTTVRPRQQVNVAIYFDISRMNQALKAISVIKNAPEGAGLACVLPGFVYALQLGLDYWDLLE